MKRIRGQLHPQVLLMPVTRATLVPPLVAVRTVTAEYMLTLDISISTVAADGRTLLIRIRFIGSTGAAFFLFGVHNESSTAIKNALA